MSTEYVMSLAQQTMLAALEISLPILAAGMVVGVVVAVFQAATQIQETSLTFVPKLIGMGLALTLFGPWILGKLEQFAIVLISSAATVGG
jgi:flagellar biosynthetic protein FliQ